ncbi:ABC transporter permease [Cytobacillus sp. Hz8]|uniref:ABC transporter permease n=1 Tax=Cytobacillus sp. Hz8 TaxID=3347168 RepID=UPI0035D5C7BD
MKTSQAIKIAFQNIIANKLRSILTMLGIIIGVAAVITLTSLGQGASKSVADEVSGLGTTMVSISLQGNADEEVVDYDELMSLKDLPEVNAVSPTVSGSGTLKNGNTSSDDVSIIGITPSYEEVKDTHVQSGRFILPIDEDNRNKVILLGSNVASDLFGFTNPIGNTIKIDGTSFKVIGILASKGEKLQGSIDDQVLIPFSTAQRFLGQTTITSADVLMKSESTVELGMAKIERILYNQFNQDDTKYNVRNQADIAEALSSVTETMTMLLAGIAGISLIVGGIGIMNIMLVSVTERTREIGIRKALGAKKIDILTQFLIEAIVLSGLGGILGVALGIGSAQLLSGILDLAVAVSWISVAIAVTFSVLIGIIFGIFPANKAANLSSLDALRYQ